MTPFAYINTQRPHYAASFHPTRIRLPNIGGTPNGTTSQLYQRRNSHQAVSATCWRRRSADRGRRPKDNKSIPSSRYPTASARPQEQASLALELAPTQPSKDGPAYYTRTADRGIEIGARQEPGENERGTVPYPDRPHTSPPQFLNHHSFLSPTPPKPPTAYLFLPPIEKTTHSPATPLYYAATA